MAPAALVKKPAAKLTRRTTKPTTLKPAASAKVGKKSENISATHQCRQRPNDLARVWANESSQPVRFDSSLPGLPVVLVTGFLGAGKTTLVNRVLQKTRQQGLRAAVFVNEFGAVDVDGALLRCESGLKQGRVLSIRDGCMCCGGQDDLASALSEDLSAIRADLDVLIVETSGVCDPGPVLAVLDNADGVHVDSVICVVDSTTVNDPEFGSSVDAHRQMSFADVILLSKADLLPNAVAMEEVEGRIRSAHSLPTRARGDLGPIIMRVLHGDVDLAALCGLGLRDSQHSAKAFVKSPRSSADVNIINDNDSSIQHSDFGTHTFFAASRFDRKRFEAWAAKLPAGIIRAKGVLWVRGVKQQMVWHFAGRRSSPLRAFENANQEEELPQGSELVFIGKYGDGWKPLEIDASLNKCLILPREGTH